MYIYIYKLYIFLLIRFLIKWILCFNSYLSGMQNNSVPLLLINFHKFLTDNGK